MSGPRSSIVRHDHVCLARSDKMEPGSRCPLIYVLNPDKIICAQQFVISKILFIFSSLAVDISFLLGVFWASLIFSI